MEATHYINHNGRTPVQVLERHEYAGREWVRVEAARPVFQSYTHGGWAAVATISVPAACVHPLETEGCTCNGVNNPNGCPACSEELQRQHGDEIPFQGE